mgnify:CR=1 FL=1
MDGCSICGLIALTALLAVPASGVDVEGVNAEIARASAAGGGVVSVPSGTHFMRGPVRLRSNVELRLSEGAVLEFSDDPEDYKPGVPVSWEGNECCNLSPLVYAFGATNVAVTGRGLLKPRMDGWLAWFANGERTPEMKAAVDRLKNDWAEHDAPLAERQLWSIPGARFRPQLMMFNRCRDVRLSDFSIRGTPFWTIHLFLCDGAVAKGLDIDAYDDRGRWVGNSDGIDIECSRNVLVEGCSFHQHDDAIVIKSGKDRDGRRLATPTENVIVRNCTVRGGPTFCAVGSELSGGIRNVRIADCRVTDALGQFLHVKTNPRRGGFVEDVTVEDVEAGDVRHDVIRVNTRYFYGCPGEERIEHELLTPIRRIVVRNVKVASAERLICLEGDENSPVEDVTLENVCADRQTDPDVIRNVNGFRRLGACRENPCVMLRFSSAQTRSLAEWKETAKALAANPGCCDDVWFSTGESFPGLDWHRRNVECLKVAADDVRRLGIGVSLQFEATIGHGDDFPTDAEKRRFDKPWKGWTGPDGCECRYCSCPRQPGFLRRLTEVSELYATIRPSVVWIDDDLRVVNHSPVTGKDGPGCWCAKCVADFAAEDGRNWTRETLSAAWKTDEGLKSRWYAFSARSMAEVACVIARAFRKVSPSTRMGLQTGGAENRLVDVIIRALVAETGEKACLRLGGGMYYDLAPYVQIVKSRKMALVRRVLALEDAVDNWCTEIETYPRAYGSRSVRSMALEAFSACGWGFDSASLFVMDRRSETDACYSDYLLGPLVRVTAFLNAYRAANRGSVPAGFRCPIDPSDERPLLGLPILPGPGVSWGELNAEREDLRFAVWDDFRTDLMPDFRQVPSAGLQRVRDRLSGSAPLKLRSPFVGVVLPRVDASGTLKTVGLIGTRLDPQENVIMQVDTASETVVWNELGEAPKDLRVKVTDGFRTVTVPSIGAWNAGYLAFR